MKVAAKLHILTCRAQSLIDKLRIIYPMRPFVPRKGLKYFPLVSILLHQSNITELMSDRMFDTLKVFYG